MSSQLFTQPMAPGHIADGAALNTSTTLTDISPTPNRIIAANTLFAGMKIRIYAAGRFSNTGTPTLLIGLYIGGVAGTAICTTGAITTTTAATNQTWTLLAYIDIRTEGTGGTVLGTGHVIGLSGTAFIGAANMPATAPATVTWDTTAAKALTVGAQWSASSASNTITCHQLSGEIL